MKRVVAGTAATLALVASLAPARTPTPVRLIPQWDHQAQFAGYYVALERGVYTRHGLDVTILRGGPGRAPLEVLGRGDADIGTFFLTAALVFRERGAPLVHLSQVMGRSHLVMVGWRDRGVTRVEDLDLRRVSLWGDQFGLAWLGLFEARAIHPVIVPQHYSVELFMRHGVDACSAMEYNELNRIFQSGVDPSEVTVMPLRDLGFGPPEDGIWALESFARANPDACRSFVAASLEGWQLAAADPAAALDIVMQYVTRAHVPTNRTHQEWMLRTVLPSIVPAPSEGRRIGELAQRDLERTVELLLQAGQLRSVPGTTAFSTLDVHAP